MVAKPFGRKSSVGLNFLARHFPHFNTTTKTRDNSENTFKMGQQKKEANRKERQGKTGDGMGNVKVKGENFYRYMTFRIALDVRKMWC
jgi:hypothetical protein